MTTNMDLIDHNIVKLDHISENNFGENTSRIDNSVIATNIEIKNHIAELATALNIKTDNITFIIDFSLLNLSSLLLILPSTEQPPAEALSTKNTFQTNCRLL